MVDSYENGQYTHTTKVLKAFALRRMLRWLWEDYGAPKLDNHVPRHTGIRPRNVTVTRAQIDALLQNAEPSVRLWILLCSDLALRSGTAAALTPEAYNPFRRELRFTTKFQAKQTIPVTDEIAELLETCDLDSNIPFVWQLRAKEHRPGMPMQGPIGEISALRREFRRLRLAAGINKRIIPHDLRRTTAVAMLEQTRDIRDVQSLLGHRHMQTTLWYLDHDLQPIRRDTLELIKRPPARQERTA